MIAARFVFRQAGTDEEFERLNRRILEAAESNPGYRGREAWRNDDGDVAVLYWWDSLEDLWGFARDAGSLRPAWVCWRASWSDGCSTFRAQGAMRLAPAVCPPAPGIGTRSAESR